MRNDTLKEKVKWSSKGLRSKLILFGLLLLSIVGIMKVVCVIEKKEVVNGILNDIFSSALLDVEIIHDNYYESYTEDNINDEDYLGVVQITNNLEKFTIGFTIVRNYYSEKVIDCAKVGIELSRLNAHLNPYIHGIVKGNKPIEDEKFVGLIGEAMKFYDVILKYALHSEVPYIGDHKYVDDFYLNEEFYKDVMKAVNIDKVLINAR